MVIASKKNGVYQTMANIFFTIGLFIIGFNQTAQATLPKSLNCNSVTECKILLNLLEKELSERIAYLTPTRPEVPKFLPIPTKADGSPELMDLSSAYTYCSQRNAVVPTIRELVLFAQAYGARGLISAEFVRETLDNSVPSGFWHFLVDKNIVGFEDFYYSPIGFNPSVLNLGHSSLWSDSTGYYLSGQYVLNGSTGYFDIYKYPMKNEVAAVACVVRQ